MLRECPASMVTLVAVAGCLCHAPVARAQTEAPPTRMVTVEGVCNDYPSARAFRQPASIPAAVVVTTRADRLRGNGGAIVRLQITRQSEWALASRNGLFVLAGHTGHQVHRDDPALVVNLVRHVLQNASAGAK